MKKDLRLLLILLPLLAITAYIFRIFLTYVPQWQCISVTDPFHRHFTAFRLSFPIFALTYLPLILFIFLNRKNIALLNIFVLGYTFILLTRMLCIWLFPLCEPGSNHHLEDSFLGHLIYPDGYSALDLMYSGHTATLFMMALCSTGQLRNYLMVCCVAVGIMLVLQKVHYTIDVLAAFPAVMACHWLAQKALGFKLQDK